MVGMRQLHVARFESGEHAPSLATVTRVSAALGVDFTLDINPGGVHLRASACSWARWIKIKLCEVYGFERAGRYAWGAP